MKVLIADDEIKVCRLIQHLVDWDALEMDIVGFLQMMEKLLMKVFVKRNRIL